MCTVDKLMSLWNCSLDWYLWYIFTCISSFIPNFLLILTYHKISLLKSLKIQTILFMPPICSYCLQRRLQSLVVKVKHYWRRCQVVHYSRPQSAYAQFSRSFFFHYVNRSSNQICVLQLSLRRQFHETNFERLTDDCWCDHACEHVVDLDVVVEFAAL